MHSNDTSKPYMNLNNQLYNLTKDSIFKTKFYKKYIEIFENFQKGKLKLKEPNSFLKQRKSNVSKPWESLYHKIFQSQKSIDDLVYHYALHTIKEKINKELLNEAIKKRIRLKDAIYLYLKPIKSLIKRNPDTTITFDLELSKNPSTYSKTSKVTFPELHNNFSKETDAEISDSEEKLKNFNILCSKKFPLNIYVGSEFKDKGRELKIYNGKYIKTFIVDKSFKLDLNSTIESNPFKNKNSGKYVYFEQPKTKSIISLKNKKNLKSLNTTNNYFDKDLSHSIFIDKSFGEKTVANLKESSKFSNKFSSRNYNLYKNFKQTKAVQTPKNNVLKSYFSNNEFYY